ncbi:MAG TPA: aldo/keto reductase [Bacteroidota bacterium]|nr:aldo/keto reductase [Bacteroidota bacterium]
MRYRTLGRQFPSVSEIGYGAWGIGGAMWKESDDAESMTALKKAVDCGVTFFDTALAYGDGHSEELIGRLRRDVGSSVIIATKIPPKNQQWPARDDVPFHEAFPKQHIIECTEKSLKHLGVERIDLQQLHVWSDTWAGADEIWSAADQLKREGKIKAFGISVNDHQPASVLKAAQTGQVDTFQVIYNIFDQSPERELFPYCVEHNIGIIVRVPFDEGGLTGAITPATTFPLRDWRNRYFQGERKQQVYDRVEKIKSVMGHEAQNVAELALRFVLSNPAVSTVIPGMRKVTNVERNTAVSDGRLLSQPLLDELKHHAWERNFYGS